MWIPSALRFRLQLGACRHDHEAAGDPTGRTARTWPLSRIHQGAISRMRGRWARERRAVVLDGDLLLPAPDDPAAESETAERAGWLRAGLATLPAPQREAIALYYFADLGCLELAAHTATVLSTVKGRLRLARAHLRATLAPLAYALE